MGADRPARVSVTTNLRNRRLASVSNGWGRQLGFAPSYTVNHRGGRGSACVREVRHPLGRMSSRRRYWRSLTGYWKVSYSPTRSYYYHARPGVSISGRNGQVLAPDSAIQLLGSAYDPEDGMLPGTSLTWTSDRACCLGNGQRLDVKTLPSGPNLITLTAMDSQGRSATARVNVVVGRERFNAQ